MEAGEHVAEDRLRVFVRGLSLVRMATSAPCSTARPISGRFWRSRSPPAPNTQISRPAVTCRRAFKTPLSAVGRVGEIDEHAERLAALDPLQPARHVADRFQPADDRGQLDAVGQPHGRRRQAVVDVVRADHLRADRHGFAARREQEGLFAEALLDRHGGDFGRRLDADRQHGAVELAQDSRPSRDRRR